MPSLRTLAPLVVAATMIFASISNATVVIVPPIEEMTWKSDVVAHGVVVEQHVERIGKSTVTVTMLEVKDGIRGLQAGETLRIEQLGGAWEGRQSWIAGALHFNIGDEMIFFGVRPSSLHGAAIPYGVGYGVFRVVDHEDGSLGRAVVERVGDVSVATRDDAGRTTLGTVQARRWDSLDAFKAMLRDTLARPEQPALPQRKVLAPRLPRKG